MSAPLEASAKTAGELFVTNTFEVPPYQREYSWQEEQVTEFFEDFQRNLESESYFLGMVILTKTKKNMHIVDGQQRIVTLTLLISALFHEAKKRNRNALAERLKADYLAKINYETDEYDPRIKLTDTTDNDTLQYIIKNGATPSFKSDKNNVSSLICNSFTLLTEKLKKDIAGDPFKRLGIWTDFITNKLYFASFIHPDSASAYSVFEVINTRGKNLTTADLLKNYIISQVQSGEKENTYHRWQNISQNFEADGTNSFVQYIRHAVTVEYGHVLPKDLFSFLAARGKMRARTAPTPPQLLDLLEKRLEAYLQMIDPSLPGPASEFGLKVYEAFNRLNIITLRPLMMAIMETNAVDEGLGYLLKLAVKRIIVSNLGTGNVERRFSEAAKKVYDLKSLDSVMNDLTDLSPSLETFSAVLLTKSLNKNILSFIRDSIFSKTIAPRSANFLHFVAPKSIKNFDSLQAEELSYWGNTIGNTFLSTKDKRVPESDTWLGFKENMVPTAPKDDLSAELSNYKKWDVEAIKKMGAELTQRAIDIWYDPEKNE